MKPIIFLFSLMLFFSLSCKNDDDTNTDTIVGTWELQSVIPLDNGNTVECNNNVTTLELFEVQNNILKASISSLNISNDNTDNCTSSTEGEYDLNGNITFDANFIPPPKNAYSYIKNGNTLTLTTTINNIEYVYNKTN